MAQARSHQRKQYLINPGFQWKIAGTIAIAVFLLTIMVSIVLFGTLHQQARLRAANPAGYTAQVTSVMVLFGLGFAAITAGGVGLWSILMTHRVCGPMFVMKRYLLEIAEGRIPSLRPLRKRDEFKDLYEAFDQAVATLRTAKQRELKQLAAAIEAAGQLQSANPGLHCQTILQRLEALRAQAQATISAPSVGPGQDQPATVSAWQPA